MAYAVAFCVGEGGRVIVILIELFVALTGLIAVWFMATTILEAIILCLVVLVAMIVIFGVIELFRK